MKKALIAAAALAVLAVAVPSHVQARNGGAVAAGVIGGLAVGAIVGGAIASQPRHYYEPAYENPRPVYVAPAGSCVVAQEVWSNRHQGYVVRNVRVPC
jgi:MFS family permease